MTMPKGWWPGVDHARGLTRQPRRIMVIQGRRAAPAAEKIAALMRMDPAERSALVKMPVVSIQRRGDL